MVRVAFERKETQTVTTFTGGGGRAVPKIGKNSHVIVTYFLNGPKVSIMPMVLWALGAAQKIVGS